MKKCLKPMVLMILVLFAAACASKSKPAQKAIWEAQDARLQALRNALVEKGGSLKDWSTVGNMNYQLVPDEAFKTWEASQPWNYGLNDKLAQQYMNAMGTLVMFQSKGKAEKKLSDSDWFNNYLGQQMRNAFREYFVTDAEMKALKEKAMAESIARSQGGW